MSRFTDPERPVINCSTCGLAIDVSKPYAIDQAGNPHHPPCVIDPNGPTRERYNIRFPTRRSHHES